MCMVVKQIRFEKFHCKAKIFENQPHLIVACPIKSSMPETRCVQTQFKSNTFSHTHTQLHTHTGTHTLSPCRTHTWMSHSSGSHDLTLKHLMHQHQHPSALSDHQRGHFSYNNNRKEDAKIKEKHCNYNNAYRGGNNKVVQVEVSIVHRHRHRRHPCQQLHITCHETINEASDQTEYSGTGTAREGELQWAGQAKL